MAEAKPRILVVEDEVAIRGGLCDVLALQGYEPVGVGDGEEGLKQGRFGGFDLVVLDVMLPGRSGFEVCEELRADHPRLPILMLTARGSEEDVLRGFRAGSDDYVTKPFSLAELLARVEALLRRASRVERERLAPFEACGFAIDPESRAATRAGERVELTAREIELLALLAQERGRIVSRRALLQQVWGMERPERIETRTVDMHVAKLRRKLGGSREWIETVRGEGYRLLA